MRHLTYPFLLERKLTTTTQAKLWSAGFVAFVIICAVVAILSAGKSIKLPTSIATKRTDNAAPPTVAERVSWMILAGLGSLALVSVTSFVARNIVSMPLIWVVPLAIYLITFVMAFGRGRYQGWPIAGPALILGLIMADSYQNEAWISFMWSLPVFMAGLFCICLYCHGELAASKPRSANVRFGSKADMCGAKRHVRFTPNSDRESGHYQREINCTNSAALGSRS